MGREVEFGDERLDSDQLAVRAAAFRLLMDEGVSVAVSTVAAHSGLDNASTRKVLQRFSAKGNALLRGEDVVGIAGLSVEPTPHRIELAVGGRWAWCAIDAVGIVGAVGDGVIRSKADHGPVELHVRDGALVPADLAVFIADGYGMTSSVDQWCPLVNFFPTLEAANTWAEQARVPGRAVALTAIAGPVIERWRAILDQNLPTIR